MLRHASQKYNLEDILFATNNFSNENLITEGALGKVYKGQLLRNGNLMNFTVRRLDYTYGQDELKTEISTLESLQHKNISSIFGYCDENNEKIIIYEQAFHGTLDQHLSDPTHLTWPQRLQICLSVACALNYIYYDTIHCDINSSKIFLDEDWDPKIYGFELSTKYPESRRHRLLFFRHFDTNNLTPKYDVYLFGMLLLEVLCGRKPIITNEGVQEEPDEIIDPNLRETMNIQSLTLFKNIAYKCLSQQLVQRPTMDQIVKQLEDVLELQWKQANPELPIAKDEVTLSNSLKMDLLKIPLSKIKQATDNFNEKYLLGSGGFATVYMAKLDVLNIQSLSSLEGKREDKLHRINKTVAIKRILNRADELDKQVFFAELELLASCNHPNIVYVLGFSMEDDELILVHEYAPKGSLADYLESNDKTFNLSWEQRLQICIDTANGINYLHTNLEGKPRIIHRDIKSGNILLDENLKAKVTDFGLSVFHPMKQQQFSTILTMRIAGTELYIDPEYLTTGKYKRESDIYSFGVVLFEVLSGRLAYDPIYINENVMGLAPIARRRFNEGTVKELIDPKLTEDDPNGILTLNRGLSQDSFHAFAKIAYACLAETQSRRPSMDVVIKELQNALNLQEYRFATNDNFSISSATNNFSYKNLITEGTIGNLYKGQFLRNGNLINFTVRRLNCTFGQGDELQTEISMLKNLEHKNIISILGHYDENNEKTIMYEHAFHGSLDQHLSDPTLTWSQRLQICLGVARALNYIHYDVIHCDINSSKILLDEDWEPKIYGFELSTKYPQSWMHRLRFSRYLGTNKLTPKYDVYSFGVLLLEVLYGRKPKITKDGVEEELDEIIDPNLRIQIGIESLRQFKDLAYKCLNQQLVQRPTMDQIVKELVEVSELQWRHANLEHSKGVEGTSSNNLKMDLLKLQLGDISEATNNFNEKFHIGSGGYGKVYKAELNVLDIQSLSSSMEGKCKEELPKITKTVAIKKINERADHEQGKEGFYTEIELLTRCNHPNVVSLLGFSIENEPILVYEYALKGSLADYLEGSDKTNPILTWAQRLQICIDTANGIDYLHTNIEGKPRIIHRDIKSDNILLDENLNAKVADFGLSKFHPRNQQASTIHTRTLVGTYVYLDPEYSTTLKYKTESDIYSFGVVLFEVLAGRVAYDQNYIDENRMGLAPIARRRFNEGTLKELIDPKIVEDDDHSFTLNRGPNQESFHTFSKIAYQCLAETQAKRPTMKVVIQELENALKLQGDTVVLSRFLLHDIVLATENFAETCWIGQDTNGKVYKAKLDQFRNTSSLATEGKNNGEPSKKCTFVAIKHITNRKDGQGKQGFFEELEMRTSYKHPNIVSLIGFCDEDDEKILVYEYVSNISLDDYLKSVGSKDSFTWIHRLHMCLEIARGLNHVHTTILNPKKIIHIDIKSANILLDKNRGPKIAYFVTNQVYNDPKYVNQVYDNQEYEKQEDIYSFGVVLFKIFCGRLAYDPEENDKGLARIVTQCFNDGTTERIIDPRLKEEMGEDIFTTARGPNKDSLDTFLKIAYECLGEAAERPTMEIVIKELQSALNFHGKI